MAIDYVTVVRDEAPRLADTVRDVDLGAPVPGLDWTVADLLLHLGYIHRWATVAASTGRVPRKDDFLAAPEDGDARAYYDTGWPVLVDALESLDPDAEGWNFAPVPQVRGFWRRRQAHETAMHRLDAEAAAGAPATLDPAFAADGIDEVLEVMAPRRLHNRDGIDIGGSIHIRCADADGQWTFRTDDGVFQLSRGEGTGDLELVGPAHALLCLLWGRGAGPAVERRGDAALLERWLALRPTP
jgi:uncharacterized protein (TIGR03083 family)